MAKYIFGKNNQMNNILSKLSTTTKELTTGILSDPEKMESIINIVRTAAPLTSAQTVDKINTYLPTLEKISTLLSMHSFLTKAQNFKPIEPASGNNAMEKIMSMTFNGDLPIGKIITEPLLKNNMEKVMGNFTSQISKNINLDDILSLLGNMTTKNSSENQHTQNNGMDFENLLNTFMPLLSNMSSKDSSSENSKDSNYENSNNIKQDAVKENRKINTRMDTSKFLDKNIYNDSVKTMPQAAGTNTKSLFENEVKLFDGFQDANTYEENISNTSNQKADTSFEFEETNTIDQTENNMYPEEIHNTKPIRIRHKKIR